MQISTMQMNNNDAVRIQTGKVDKEHDMLKDIASNMVILTIAFFFLGVIERPQVEILPRLFTAATQAFPIVGLVTLAQDGIRERRVRRNRAKWIARKRKLQREREVEQNRQKIINFLQQI
jgi:hypothetical protein